MAFVLIGLVSNFIVHATKSIFKLQPSMLYYNSNNSTISSYVHIYACMYMHNNVIPFIAAGRRVKKKWLHKSLHSFYCKFGMRKCIYFCFRFVKLGSDFVTMLLLLHVKAPRSIINNGTNTPERERECGAGGGSANTSTNNDGNNNDDDNNNLLLMPWTRLYLSMQASRLFEISDLYISQWICARSIQKCTYNNI